jgi:hypothetical protein
LKQCRCCPTLIPNTRLKQSRCWEGPPMQVVRTGRGARELLRACWRLAPSCLHHERRCATCGMTTLVGRMRTHRCEARAGNDDYETDEDDESESPSLPASAPALRVIA